MRRRERKSRYGVGTTVAVAISFVLAVAVFVCFIALLVQSGEMVEQGYDGLTVRDDAGNVYVLERHSWDLYEVTQLRGVNGEGN